jgi:hypothetical protein
LIPAINRELRQRKSISARALEFLILTAGRTKEVIEFEWPDIHDDLWVVERQAYRPEPSVRPARSGFTAPDARPGRPWTPGAPAARPAGSAAP